MLEEEVVRVEKKGDVFEVESSYGGGEDKGQGSRKEVFFKPCKDLLRRDFISAFLQLFFYAFHLFLYVFIIYLMGVFKLFRKLYLNTFFIPLFLNLGLFLLLRQL